MGILLDTSVIYARYNEEDKNHGRAKEIYRKFMKGEFGNVYLIDYIFDELVSLIQYRTNRNDLATDIGNLVLEDTKSYLRHIQVNTSIFERAWELFQDQESKKFLSFTDCVLIASSQVLSIEYVTTFDNLFKSFVAVIDS